MMWPSYLLLLCGVSFLQAADTDIARRLSLLEHQLNEEKQQWTRERQLLTNIVSTLQTRVVSLENSLGVSSHRQARASDTPGTWQPSFDQLTSRVDQLGAEMTALNSKVDREYLSALGVSVDAKVHVLNDTVNAELSQVTGQMSGLKNGMGAFKSEMRMVINEVISVGQRVQTAMADVQLTRSALGILEQTVSRDNIVSAVNDTIQAEVNKASSGLSTMIQTVDNKIRMTTTALTQKISREVQTLGLADSAQLQAVQNAATSTFTRWGRSSCPASSELVYSGVVGGGLFSKGGSSPDVLCLPTNPVLEDLPVPSVFSEMYGAEYQTAGSDNRDPVCAVCRTFRPTTIMIPATNVCPAGWTPDYSGYLMGGSPDHASGHQFVCVDSSMESRPDSDDNNNGLLLFHTFTRCGSLPCPAYEDAKAVTCVVCSK